MDWKPKAPMNHADPWPAMFRQYSIMLRQPVHVVWQKCKDVEFATTSTAVCIRRTDFKIAPASREQGACVQANGELDVADRR